MTLHILLRLSIVYCQKSGDNFPLWRRRWRVCNDRPCRLLCQLRWWCQRHFHALCSRCGHARIFCEGAYQCYRSNAALSRLLKSRRGYGQTRIYQSKSSRRWPSDPGCFCVNDLPKQQYPAHVSAIIVCVWRLGLIFLNAGGPNLLPPPPSTSASSCETFPHP